MCISAKPQKRGDRDGRSHRSPVSEGFRSFSCIFKLNQSLRRYRSRRHRDRRRRRRRCRREGGHSSLRPRPPASSCRGSPKRREVTRAAAPTTGAGSGRTAVSSDTRASSSAPRVRRAASPVPSPVALLPRLPRRARRGRAATVR